jgi:hypothetical protein
MIVVNGLVLGLYYSEGHLHKAGSRGVQELMHLIPFDFSLPVQSLKIQSRNPRSSLFFSLIRRRQPIKIRECMIATIVLNS